MTQVIFAVLAVILLGILILRKKKGAEGIDLIQYALAAAFIGIAAAAIVPGITGTINSIFQEFAAMMQQAAQQ